MKHDNNESIRISIENLTVGMFVTAIEHSVRVNLANAGRVPSKTSIDQLIKSGVKYAWVDRALSVEGSKIIPAPEANEIEDITPTSHDEPAPHSAARRRKPISRDLQQKKATVLIRQAKNLAQKLISDTFSGKSILVEDIDGWADDIVESALHNSDALHCVSALRNKDAYLLEHSVNVACLLVTFGKHLNLDREVLKQMAIGGIVHDVGKIKVDDKVLHKPARLTPEEFEHMKLHQVYAEEIVSNVKGLSDIARDVCLMHHEKLDGSGYPYGLKGDELPLHGRMSSIVDIYDALTSDRVYKKGMSSAEAFKVMLGLTPHHLDKDLVYKLINCIGVFPVGSIVELSDSKVGIVWESNQVEPLKPIVKCFYSIKYKRYTDVNFTDLKKTNLKILNAIAPSNLAVDPKPFYE